MTRRKQAAATGWSALADELAALRVRLVEVSTLARDCADHAPVQHPGIRINARTTTAAHMSLIGRELIDWERQARVLHARITQVQR